MTALSNKGDLGWKENTSIGIYTRTSILICMITNMPMAVKSTLMSTHTFTTMSTCTCTVMSIHMPARRMWRIITREQSTNRKITTMITPDMKVRSTLTITKSGKRKFGMDTG